MLPPVRAVSVVGAAAAVEKPVAAAAIETPVSATPLAILSNAVNTSVEDKLTALLVEARERMFDSLFEAIDAASAALNITREPDESSTAFAQRLSDTIRSLPPQQLAAVQQQLDTDAKLPIPLPLIADALDNPDGPEAARIALTLELAQPPQPEAIIKAVVNSYGQNAGEAEIVEPQVPVPAQQPASAPAVSNAAALPAAVAQAPVEIPTAAGPSVVVAQVQSASPESEVPAQVISHPTAVVEQQTPPDLDAAPNAQAPNASTVNSQPAPAPAPQAANTLPIVAASAAPPETAAPVQEEAAAKALPASPQAESKLSTEIAQIRSPTAPPDVPRDIQQIRADLKEGLKLVIGRIIDAVGPDLLQIMGNDERLTERVVAQALAANVQDQEELRSLAQATGSEGIASSATPMANQAPLLSEKAPEAQFLASALLGKAVSAAPVTSLPEMTDTPAQMGTPPLPLVGIPFAVAQYLPADVSVEDEEDPEAVDRTDPVDDEEHEQGQGGEAAPDDEEADQPQHGSQEHQAEASDASEADPSQARGLSPKVLALPTPAPAERLHDHAFDFYRRMVGWE